MSDCLHRMLLVLALLDLAFVGATEVVPWLGLLPLLSLALVSPWLRRLQRFRLYRASWNMGVLIVFAMLVHHASTTGLLHMLEDGLLLAVLCQVHLLNNVGNRQRPDLVFFNSFLIAFVTSFFATHMAWSALFVIHALVFVPALELNVIARRTGTIDGRTATALLRDSLPRTAAIGVCTVLVFVFCPRDFHHEGWLGHAFSQQAGLHSGLAEMIRLDDEGSVRLSNKVVMRITTRTNVAVPAPVPTHWRAITYAAFDGRSWQPRTDVQADSAWQRARSDLWQRPAGPVAGALHVELMNNAADRLPLPLAACQLQLLQAQGVMLDPRAAAGFACFRNVDAPEHAIEYEVRVGEGAARSQVRGGIRRVFLQLPRRAVVRTARQLAERVTAELPRDASHAEIARATADWLRENRRYQLPGGQGFAGSIAGFAIGSGAGHCEYFATVLALMLRSQDVPCRLVGGYLAHELSDDGTTVVRSRHAHAWVEVLLPDGSWMTVDATPPQSTTDTDGDDDSWLAAISASLDSWWHGLVGFDDGGRARLLGALQSLPSAAAQFALAYPLGTVGLLALPFALHYCRRRQRRQPLVIASLFHAARAAGLNLLAGETPRELLARARTTAVPDHRVAALAAAVRQHERARYGCAEDVNQ